MRLVNTRSLGATIDAVDAAFFFGRTVSKSAQTEAANWIAARQGLPRSYAGMFAPTQDDFRNGITLFTGERITTRAGIAHVLGEEACRALILLNVAGAPVRKALDSASEGIMTRLRVCDDRGPGFYCCGRCTVALWRHLAAGGLDGENRLAAGSRP